MLISLGFLIHIILLPKHKFNKFGDQMMGLVNKMMLMLLWNMYGADKKL